MSLRISMETNQKDSLAQILRAIADLVERSGDKTVSIILDTTFSPGKKDC